MKKEEAQQWARYISETFDHREMTEVGLILDEDTILNLQRDPQDVFFRLELRKLIELPNIEYSRRAEKAFKKKALPILNMNRMDGMVVEMSESSILLIAIMTIVNIFDAPQMDGLLQQFNKAPYEAKASMLSSL